MIAKRKYTFSDSIAEKWPESNLFIMRTFIGRHLFPLLDIVEAGLIHDFKSLGVMVSDEVERDPTRWNIYFIHEDEHGVTIEFSIRKPELTPPEA